MVTIKDLAKMAGVSHTTISRALNDSPLIKAETKEKIKALAKENNYVPNFSAKSLVNHRSYRIGLLFSSIDQGTSASFLVDVIRGITKILSDHYTLSVIGLDTLESFSHLQAQLYDGFIFMSQSDTDDPFIEFVQKAHVPLVVLNRQLDEKETYNVAANDAKGVEEAITYGIKQGHKKIAMIGGKVGFRSATERKKGFLTALAKNQISFETDYFISGDYSLKSGGLACEKLLQLKIPPTLIFCANDDMAIGAMKACQKQQIKIPHDMAIIGFDNILFADYTTPTLTTVSKPIQEMAQVGTQMLLNLLQQKEISQKQLLLDTTLILRESV